MAILVTASTDADGGHSFTVPFDFQCWEDAGSYVDFCKHVGLTGVTYSIAETDPNEPIVLVFDASFFDAAEPYSPTGYGVNASGLITDPVTNHPTGYVGGDFYTHSPEGHNHP